MIEGHARCKKDVCRLSETDPRHRRTRSSILVRWNGKNVLIDASLDFRQHFALFQNSPSVADLLPRIKDSNETFGSFCLAGQCQFKLAIGADARRTALGHFNGRFFAIFLNADHDAQGEAEAAGQEKQEQLASEPLPAPGG